MKLRCCLVRKKLAGTFRTDELPDRVVRHIERCESCRKEAQAYAKMSVLMQDYSSDLETSRLTWDRLKYELPSQEARRPVMWLKPAVAAAAAVVILAAGLMTMKHQPEPNMLPKPPETASIQKEGPEPKALNTETAQKPDKEPAVAVVPKHTEPERIAKNTSATTGTATVRRIAKSDGDRPASFRLVTIKRERRRPADTPVIAIAKNRKPKRISPSGTQATSPEAVAENPREDKTDNDTAPVALICAEEHVINVVGITPETDDDTYCVIERVQPQYEVRPVRL